MTNVLFTIDLLLEIYTWILLAAAVMSWLIGFNVITSDKPALAMIRKVLDTLTEPVRRPMRRILPDLGGVDISPLLLIVWIMAIRYGMVFFSVGRSTVAY
jgi:YggT family protein